MHFSQLAIQFMKQTLLVVFDGSKIQSGKHYEQVTTGAVAVPETEHLAHPTGQALMALGVAVVSR